ncbi:acetyl-CoA synthetase-like protein [Dothidotthia symphoricarpi CBS 119687]|uniref:Acetyl-CoA synthetase-like protein n=1 Tax=Dothidotthia symphoricarpi CBS 119687 TaxID=1392245 RepID=A0A6A6AUB9_9PLEO|nr:acetyl-CoA synthetase-like protein [Dothidotthia symphoricarpi CBS 119687]KAF2134544.1 acetyl-CoA synthetase-like protein [Dothidotthia symphoricarpi CBS 119687]
MSTHIQDQVYANSISDPETFWASQAESVHWHKKPTRAFEKTTKHLKKSNVSHDHWHWFPDGEISTTYNCVDRHVANGNGENVAIYWDSPVTGQKERYTYKELLQEVETLAGVLREEGVKKGDVVLIYMPMIPAALFAMLAIARLGAIHSVVFGGFSPAALAQRIEASRPVAIMTASCGIEGSKGPTEYKSMIEGAVHKSSFKPSKTIIWQREQLRWDPVLKEEGERNWQRLIKSAKNRGLKADAVPVESGDGLYVIYTSGTTGTPKGVVRSAGGHAVGLNFSMKYLFGVQGPGDVMFTASDIGWVVGHSFIVYAPLLVGATTVLFEGKPVGTPDASTFWRIVNEYKVNTMFTAPTALRAIRRDDSDNEFFEKRYGEKGGLKSLRSLFLAGERSEPSIVERYQKLLAKHCAPGAVVVDNWWSSESGSPISGIALSASAGLDFSSTDRPKPLPIKPGSAGKAMPGFDVRVVDDEGKEVKRGEMGNIVMSIPLAPTAFTTLWEDEERFYKGYMKRFDGKWIDTGDAGLIDEEGYISIMARADDVINVAAHRFSTGAIEQAITTHPSIAEAAVIGIPDALKGHLPFAFVTLATHPHPSPAVPDSKLLAEVQNLVREQIGAIATLGGVIQGKGMIPKTRSGKTLRRVLRELTENATHAEFDKEVSVPSTIEDRDAVDVARMKIREYFEVKGKHLHKAIETRAKL